MLKDNIDVIVDEDVIICLQFDHRMIEEQTFCFSKEIGFNLVIFIIAG